MYKILFIDTETTGLCNMRTPYNQETLYNEWPFLTQVAWSIVEVDANLESFKSLKEVSYYISPTFSDAKYSKEALEKTGITYQTLKEQGISSSQVLKEFFQDLTESHAAVAHNATFDMKVIKAEVFRLGWDNHMRVVPWIDTCYYGSQLCKIKDSKGRNKYPTLSELFQKVTGATPIKAHNALDDIRTLITSFRGLTSIKVLNRYHNYEPIIDAKHFKAILAKHQEKLNSSGSNNSNVSNDHNDSNDFD